MHSAFAEDEVNQSCDYFMSDLTYFFNLACPVKVKLLKDRSKIAQKWITKDILQLIEEVDLKFNWFKKFKESGLESEKSSYGTRQFSKNMTKIKIAKNVKVANDLRCSDNLNSAVWM